MLHRYRAARRQLVGWGLPGRGRRKRKQKRKSVSSANKPVPEEIRALRTMTDPGYVESLHHDQCHCRPVTGAVGRGDVRRRRGCEAQCRPEEEPARPAASSRPRVDPRHTDRSHTVRNADPWIRAQPTGVDCDSAESTGVRRSGRRRLVVAPPPQVALELPGDGISTGLGKVGGVRRLLEVVDVLGHLVV